MNSSDIQNLARTLESCWISTLDRVLEATYLPSEDQQRIGVRNYLLKAAYDDKPSDTAKMCLAIAKACSGDQKSPSLQAVADAISGASEFLPTKVLDGDAGARGSADERSLALIRKFHQNLIDTLAVLKQAITADARV